jgi:hypothetical protein
MLAHDAIYFWHGVQIETGHLPDDQFFRFLKAMTIQTEIILGFPNEVIYINGRVTTGEVEYPFPLANFRGDIELVRLPAGTLHDDAQTLTRAQ